MLSLFQSVHKFMNNFQINIKLVEGKKFIIMTRLQSVNTLRISVELSITDVKNSSTKSVEKVTCLVATYSELSNILNRVIIFQVASIQFATMCPVYLKISMLMVVLFFGKEAALETLKTLILEIGFPDHISTFTFSRVNRALANKYLPVWMTTNTPGREFKKIKMMDRAGKVSFFHDTCTKSSLVYFHKRREIEGVIDVRYSFKRLPINEKAEVQHFDHSFLHVVNHFEEAFNTRSLRSIGNTTLNRSQRNPQQIFYPELLIAINNNAFNAIEENSKLPPGVATVSHVLTVYNAVDLVYRLLPSPAIQLNIAGIVIEGIPNQWTFESEVIANPPIGTGRSSKVYVNADSMHIKISDYFWQWQNNFPRHSYDMIQYLTTSLLKNKFGKGVSAQSKPLKMLDFMFPYNSVNRRITTVNQIFESYKHFTVIAHETAHIFKAQHDGIGRYGHLFDVKSCRKSLMATIPICSESCLKWSPQTHAEFERYFRKAPSRCNMMNYPRSLSVLKPKKIHTPAEQCECYGYQPILESHESVSRNECTAPILCKQNGIRTNIPTSWPMDGTPCGSTRVCWNNNCEKYRRKFWST